MSLLDDSFNVIAMIVISSVGQNPKDYLAV